MSHCFCPEGVGVRLADDLARSGSKVKHAGRIRQILIDRVCCRYPADRRQAGLPRLRQNQEPCGVPLPHSAPDLLIVPTLPVVTQRLTLRVNVDAERPARHSHAGAWGRSYLWSVGTIRPLERGNDQAAGAWNDHDAQTRKISCTARSSPPPRSSTTASSGFADGRSPVHRWSCPLAC